MMEKTDFLEKEDRSNVLPMIGDGNGPVPSTDLLDDPLAELLNEFSEYDDFEEDEDEDESLVLQELDSKHSVTSTQIKNPFHKRNNYTKLVKEQVDLLEETTKRMKFLLDEIDLYLPEIKERESSNN